MIFQPVLLCFPWKLPVLPQNQGEMDQPLDNLSYRRLDAIPKTVPYGGILNGLTAYEWLPEGAIQADIIHRDRCIPGADHLPGSLHGLRLGWRRVCHGDDRQRG